MLNNYEEWRDVLGAEYAYQISNKGRIRSNTRMTVSFKNNKYASRIKRRIMKTHLSSKGYEQLFITVCGKRLKKYIHRLVVEAFRGRIPYKMHVRHLDGCKENNNLNNLVIGTPAENVEDSIKHGSLARGSRNGKAKLTEDIVKMIRQSCKTSKEMSLKYKVSINTIRSILRRDTWKHVV